MVGGQRRAHILPSEENEEEGPGGYEPDCLKVQGCNDVSITFFLLQVNSFPCMLIDWLDYCI